MNKIQSSSAQKWLEKDRHVWVKANNQYPNPNQDAFLQGKIIQIQKSHVRVLLVQSNQQFKISFQDCLKLTYGPKDVADMVDLQQLNEPELLYNIKRRYIEDSIFTYCGPTLLIINPYTKIQRLFNDNVLQQYQAYVFTDTLQYKNLAPHIFGLAAFCLWQLFDNQRNQSIVISGQSGAGKTQNTKYCLKFLASLGKNMKQLLLNQSQSLRKSRIGNNLRAAQKAIKKTTNSKVFGMQQKILGCNQILQAFGNAKTIRNDNSSRFGKLILLVYGQTQIQIKSAFIISYLLQKSRIVSVAQGQRNYHIFYYFIQGTSEQQKKKYLLKQKVHDYYYLNQSTIISIPGVDDKQKFDEIKKEFQLYLTQDQIQSILKILSVVLNLGNIKFKKTQTKNNEQSVLIQTKQQLKIISELLQINYQQLEHSFHYKTKKLGLSVINSPLKYQEAISLRDSFSKNMYQKIFNFLIKKLNQKIQIQQISFDDQKSSNVYRKSIGLLDIFGFQVLNFNSLEQFFINFANQKLQQLYVSYIFKQEQNQFMREGLRQFSHDIGFQDNKPIIDLFQNYPLGIFHLINQSSQLNQDDKDLPSSIQKNHSKNKFLKIPKAQRSAFEIVHSCSPVFYNTNGFTVKNKDQFPQQLLNMIEKSSCKQIQKICIGQQKKQSNQQTQKGNRNASKKFLGSKFLNEMNKLIQQLYSCDCHFVRCIKPNSKKSPKLFNSYAVLQSLRYLGVLDSIIIRKLGYIYRRPFKQFYKKFYQLDQYIFSFHSDILKFKSEEDFKKQCQKIINKYAKKELEQNDILFGNKKILIKQSALNHLQLLTKQRKKLRINAANRFKYMYKSAVFRTKVRTFLNSIKILKIHLKFLAIDIKQKIRTNKIVKIQNVVKKFLWQRRLQKIKVEATKSVTKISAYLKMKRQRRIFLETKQKTLKLQNHVRAFLAMNKIFRNRLCMNIVKGILESSWNQIKKQKAILIQKIFKGFQTRKKFKKAIQMVKRNLKMAKIRNRFKRAIFQHKYNKFSQALNKYKKPIIKLQAIVRGKFAFRLYNLIKKNTIVIQRAFKKHLKKRFYICGEWQQFKQIITKNQIQNYKQLRKLGGQIRQIKKFKQLDQTIGISKTVSPQETISNYIKRKDILQQKKGLFKSSINESIQFNDKNTFQVYMLDIDSCSYDGLQDKFLNEYEKIKQNLKQKKQYIIFVEIIQNSLIVVSNKDKIYRLSIDSYQHSHDKNQYLQELSGMGIVNKIQSSQNGNLVYLSEQNKTYTWGNLQFVQNIQSIAKNDKIGFKNKSIKNQSISHYVSKGYTQYLVFQSKIILQKKKQLFREQISNFQLSQKNQILTVAASYHFVHFLTTTGQLYSKGKNKKGQLGLGNSSAQVRQLTLNRELLKIKQFIQIISVGFGHTVCKSKLGNVYAWGDNNYGQLGINNCKYTGSPRKIQQTLKNVKVYQVAAGLKASYFLGQNLKVYGTGTSLTLNENNNKVTELLILEETNIRGRNLSPVKLRCSWSLNRSVLTINAIDTSRCKQNSKPDAILKYIKSTSKQWIQSTIYPLYHQYLDNVLNLSDLRKLKFKMKNYIKVEKKKQDKLSNLQELKMIIELRKTSSMFKQAALTKSNQFLQQINKKKIQLWTDQQKQIHDLIVRQMKLTAK